MTFSIHELVLAMTRATLFLTVTAVLVGGLIRLFRCSSAKIQQVAWFLVLIQGVVWARWPLNIPWYAPFTSPSSSDALPALQHNPSLDRSTSRPQNPGLVMTGLPGGKSENAESAIAMEPAATARDAGCPSGWHIVLLVWVTGIVGFAAFALRKYLRFCRRLRTVESPEADWALQWRQLLASRNVKRSIPFCVSQDIGPALCLLPSGYRVVVPETTWAGLTPRQRWSLLRHELAHYEHGDLWRCLGVRLLALLHWFNPLSWWAVHKFEECTEWLCDNAAMGDETSAAEYARALMQFGSSQFPRTSWVGAAQGGRLFHRIHRLISQPCSEDSKMKKIALISLVLALLLVGSVRIHLVAKEPAGNTPAAKEIDGTNQSAATASHEAKPAKDIAEKPATQQPTKSAEPNVDTGAPFQDEPAAHALYDQMIEALRKADSLSYVSHYTWEAEGQTLGDCTYRAWLKKPNYFRVEAESNVQQEDTPKSGGILIGDGSTLWLYWLQERPRFYEGSGPTEDDEAYEKTRLTSYMKKPAPVGGHSIGHETSFLGAGMCMPIIDPSTFHGYTDSLQAYVDGVKALPAEKVGDEDCDQIEVSIMKHQRSWYLWLSKTDHLPRKLKGIVRVSHDIVTHEEWSAVTRNADIPGTMFQWKPPEGWTQWRMPRPEEKHLKPGTKAPDFELASADGKRIRLSDFRGQVVWLCIWRVGCPPCREELPYLERFYTQYKDKGLVILGLNPADDRQIAMDFIREKGLTFPNIVDTSEAAKKAAHEDYRSSGVPLNYIIDREGNIVDSIYGFDEGEVARGTALLERLGGELGEAIRQERIAAAKKEPGKPDSQSWTLANGRTMCESHSSPTVSDELKQLIAAKKYELVKKFDSRDGEKQCEYRFTLSNGSREQRTFLMPLEDVSSWDDYQRKLERQRELRHERINQAITAGRARLLNLEVLQLHICRDIQSNKKFKVQRIALADHTEIAIPRADYGEIPSSVKQTSWQEHLQAICDGKRELLELETVNSYSYEMTADDGTKVIFQYGGGEPLKVPESK